MRLTLAAPLAAVLLAACGQTAEPVANRSAATAGEHGYIAKVKALGTSQREGVLFRAIRSGGGASCQDIKQVDDKPATRDGQPAWLVTCIDDSQWYVTLADNGTATVTGARAS